MATLTKTFTEDQETSHRSYWTLTFSASNIIATGSSISFPVAMSAKYQANKDSARISVTGGVEAWNGTYSGGTPGYWKQEIWKSWPNNTVKSAGSSTYSFNTGSIFTSANKTTRTVNLSLCIDGISAESWQNPSGKNQEHWNGYEEAAFTPYSIGTIATVTLNVPPICTATTQSSGAYYAGISTYTVNVSGLTAYYGGTISSVVLNVGGKTASRTNNGALSVVVPSTAGTYTPTVTVTDSRGQAKTYSQTAITVSAHTAPTLTPTVTSSAPYYNVRTTYSVTASNVTAYDGATVSSVVLRLGSQEDAKTSSFTNPFTITPGTSGSFTPTITITDSYGSSKEYRLDDISVLRYGIPSVTFDVIRTDGSGKSADEGKSAVIKATFAWTSDVAKLTVPTTVVTDLDGNTKTTTVTWYSSWTNTGGVSNAIGNSWANVSNMPVYALVKNGSDDLFDLNESYYLSITPKDDMPNDGNTGTQTLGSAFYTVDFRAGGHGIAFGQTASQDGFFCNMDAHFVDKNDVMRALFDFVYPVGSYYETSKPSSPPSGSQSPTSADLAVLGDTWFDPRYVWGGTWELEAEGRVHISTGTGYALGTTGGSPDAIVPYHTHGDTISVSVTSSGSCTTNTTSKTLTGNWYCVNLNSVTADGIMSKAAYSSSAYTGFSSNNRAGSKVHIDATHTHGVPNHTHTTSKSGGVSYAGTSGAEIGANMQPYIVVSRWHRTA